MQTEFSVTQAAKAWGKSRNTISKHLRDGTLSKSSKGKIALVELLRVYGALPTEQAQSSSIEPPRAAQNMLSERTEQVEQLKRQVAFLEGQVAWLQKEIEQQRQARIGFESSSSRPAKRGLLARILGD
jgi:TolA-binding protein